MLLSIIFIVIWCLLIISNIITLVECFRIKKKLHQGKWDSSKLLGAKIKENLSDDEKVGAVDIGLNKQIPVIEEENDMFKKVIEAQTTIQDAFNLVKSKDGTFVAQSMKNRIDIDKAQRFLDRVIEEAEDYRY